MPGYAASVWGGDCAADGTIILALGDVKTCTITNDDVAPTLTVINTVINDNGGTGEVGYWVMDVAGENVSATGFPGVEALGVTVTLHPGTFSVNESGGPPSYHKTFSAGCAGIIALGESITCTITNNDIGPRLTVIKAVVNDNGGDAVASDWSMDISGANVSNTGFNGVESGVAITLNAGAYNVSESGGPSGYVITRSASCSGAIGLGDVVICTITGDDIPPQLTVTTKVLNDSGGSAVAGDWGMDIFGGNVSSTGFNGAEAGVGVTLDAGAYSVSESGGPPGYAMSFSADCSGVISLGEDLSCTITNDDIAPNVPTLTVIKLVVNDNGGSAVAGDWNMDISGGNVSSTGFVGVESGVTITLDASAYNVSESGGPSGYAPTLSPGCSGHISAGDVLTCTVTSDDIASKVPTLTVTNTVINDDDGSAAASDWNMDISGENVSNTGFAGAESGFTITLDAGAYNVSESGGPSGYAPTLSPGCSGDIDLGEDLTCTVTNDDIAPQLTVIKTVVNSGGGSALAGDWIMDIAGDNVSNTGFVGVENPGVTITLNARAYSVGERGGPSGYAISRSDDCSGTIGLGDVLICTITADDITSQLTVINTVINDGGGSALAGDWNVNIAGFNVSSAGFQGVGNPGVAVTLDPGVYSVSVVGGRPGYAMTLSVDCSGAIGLGDDLTCTITNDDRDPQLTTIVKVVNDNGSATASDWTMDITGANVSNTRFLGAETGVTVTLDPGVYNVGESGGPSGYAMSFSVNCSGAIRLGDHLACTITNDDITPNVPTLTVTTNVVNDDLGSALASDWTVDITGDAVSGTGFAGSESGVTITITIGAGAYAVSESGGPAGYTLTHSDDCSGDIGLADVLTCIITANDEPAALVPPPNALPTASIASPADESTFTTDFNIAFSGSGVDAEDGVLNGGSLRWTSSIDGEIGIGQSVTGSLAAGNHTITLTATDSQGALASASFALTIKAPDAPGGSGGGGIAPDPTPQPIVIAQPTATSGPPTSTPAPTPTSQPTPKPTPTLGPPAETPTSTVTPQPTDLPAPTQVAAERSTPAPAAMPSPPNPTDGDGLSVGALTAIGSGVFAVLAASIFFGLWRSTRVSTAARSRTLWARARVGRIPR